MLWDSGVTLRVTIHQVLWLMLKLARVTMLIFYTPLISYLNMRGCRRHLNLCTCCFHKNRVNIKLTALYFFMSFFVFLPFYLLRALVPIPSIVFYGVFNFILLPRVYNIKRCSFRSIKIIKFSPIYMQKTWWVHKITSRCSIYLQICFKKSFPFFIRISIFFVIIFTLFSSNFINSKVIFWDVRYINFHWSYQQFVSNTFIIICRWWTGSQVFIIVAKNRPAEQDIKLFSNSSGSSPKIF